MNFHFPDFKLKLFFVLLLNAVALITLYLVLNHFGVFDILPSNENVVQWDAVWYEQIKVGGYKFIPDEASNMAFFPLFALFWKVLGASGLFMSLINGLLFFVALTVLVSADKVSRVYLVVIASIPNFIFFFLPYSESLFFMAGVLLIIGYKTNSFISIALGIFVCCLTRAVSTVFIPIIIITELYIIMDYSILKHSLRRIFGFVGVAIFCIVIVVLMQYIQTGKWFYFIEAVSLYNRHFVLPSIPFTTYSAPFALGIDGIAWVFGAIVTYFFFTWILAKIHELWKGILQPNRIGGEVIFSALFIISVLILDTLFTNKVEGATNLWSINRHLLCTPFAICFLNWYYFKYTPNKADLWAIIAILVIGIFITGIVAYQHHIFYYVIFFSGLILGKFSKHCVILLFPIYAFNLYLFVVFFYQFIHSGWVG
jgi:hypothetical protein